MSFNIEWTNADALTPSPFTVTKDGCHYEVKVDAHYVSDEEMQTLRRYVERLQVENAKLREQIHWLKKGDILHVLTDQEFAEQQKHEREMQASIKALDDENAKLREQLEGIVGRSFRTADKMACLEAENAKLRQLVEDMLDCIEIRAAWHRPPTDEMYEEFAQRARELGVEV